MLRFTKHCKDASREIDDFNVALFHIYWGIDVPIIIALQNVLTKLLQKEYGAVFGSQCRSTYKVKNSVVKKSLPYGIEQAYKL